MPSNQLEQQLLSEFKQVEPVYRRALSTIQASLPQGDGTCEEIETCLARLQPLMEQTQQLELQLAPARQAWLKLKQRPGPELKKVLALHEELLMSLIQRINSLEQSMQRFRTAAIPEIDRVVKHQQMQRAYQQLSR